MTNRLQTGGQERIIVMPVNATGVPVVGLFVRCTVLRQNGTWFKSSTRTWQATAYENSMTESPLRAGQYEFVFWPPDGGGYQCSIYAYVWGGVGSGNVVNGPWLGDIIVGGFVDYLDASVASSGSNQNVLDRIGNSNVSDELRRQLGILNQILGRV